jgi:rubrerythrin
VKDHAAVEMQWASDKRARQVLEVSFREQKMAAEKIAAESKALAEKAATAHANEVARLLQQVTEKEAKVNLSCFQILNERDKSTDISSLVCVGLHSSMLSN